MGGIAKADGRGGGQLFSSGLALYATNISCVHLVSLAQAGYDSERLTGNFEMKGSNPGVNQENDPCYG